MTEKPEKPQQYWYIQVPAQKFPQPKFHPGQQVRLHWEDEHGMSHDDIGEIIGMLYGASDYKCSEWYYLIRFLKCEKNPSLVGKDDGYFVEESSLVADNTAIP